jgi:hypothetical protein
MKNVMARHAAQIVTVEHGYDNFYNLKITDPNMVTFNQIQGDLS